MIPLYARPGKVINQQKFFLLLRAHKDVQALSVFRFKISEILGVRFHPPELVFTVSQDTDFPGPEELRKFLEYFVHSLIFRFLRLC